MRYHGTTPLIGGYRYFYSDNGVIIDLSTANEARSLKAADVGPDVDGYRVYPHLIVGHAVKEKDKNYWGDRIPTCGNSKPGYFIIDMRNDSVYDGLSKQDWLKKLRTLGINSRPHLYKPSIYDGILGRNKPAR